MFTPLLVGLAFDLIVNQSNGSPTSLRQKEITGKIVGGVPVDLEKFPHSVQIFIGRSEKRSICAGSILNSYTVLSAAHCFNSELDISLIRVLSGGRFLYDSNASAHRVQLLVLHEHFNISTYLACDIALVFLRRPIKFSKVAQKAIIVNTDEWMSEMETNFSVVGWGETKYGGSMSRDGLLMAQMRYISLDKCRKANRAHFTEDMFCLYGEGQRDACRGDSGGGVIWRDMLVGVTSHGRKCSQSKGSPSVYANVWYFRDWIKKQIDEFAAIFCESKNKQQNHSTENDYQNIE